MGFETSARWRSSKVQHTLRIIVSVWLKGHWKMTEKNSNENQKAHAWLKGHMSCTRESQHDFRLIWNLTVAESLSFIYMSKIQYNEQKTNEFSSWIQFKSNSTYTNECQLTSDYYVVKENVGFLVAVISPGPATGASTCTRQSRSASHAAFWAGCTVHTDHILGRAVQHFGSHCRSK